MILIPIIGLALCACGLIFCAWFGIRNDKVADFRHFILDLNSRIEQKNIKAGGDFNGHLLYLKLPSYKKQLMSLRKLTIESYFDVEDQAVLNSALEEKIKTTTDKLSNEAIQQKLNLPHVINWLPLRGKMLDVLNKTYKRLLSKEPTRL